MNESFNARLIDEVIDYMVRMYEEAAISDHPERVASVHTLEKLANCVLLRPCQRQFADIRARLGSVSTSQSS